MQPDDPARSARAAVLGLKPHLDHELAVVHFDNAAAQIIAVATNGSGAWAGLSFCIRGRVSSRSRFSLVSSTGPLPSSVNTTALILSLAMVPDPKGASCRRRLFVNPRDLAGNHVSGAKEQALRQSLPVLRFLRDA